MKTQNITLGWLTPSGILYESAWGEHQTIAKKIIDDLHWLDEYKNSEYNTFGDFLNKEKNFVLIDNPSMTEIKITPGKYLTKNQKSYLYDLYKSIGITKPDLYSD